MTTTQPATVPNPGADDALEVLQRSAPQDDFSYLTDWALKFLDMLVPENHPAREPLNLLAEHMEVLARSARDRANGVAGVPTGTPSQREVEQAVVRGAIRPVKEALVAYPIAIQVIASADQLEAFRAERGLGRDWHEPDNQNIEAHTSPGTFDNASLHPYYLEQSVFFYDTSDEDSPVPVAAANLAALCSWATGYQA